MCNTRASPTQQSPSTSRLILYSHKRGRPSGITVSLGMEEMLSQNMPVRRLMVAILPLDLPCSGLNTHSEETVNTDISHKTEAGRIIPGFNLN